MLKHELKFINFPRPAARDGCYERAIGGRSRWQPSPLTRNNNTLGNKLRWFECQYRHVYIFWVCFKLTNTELNRAVAHLLFNNTFQKLSLLHWQG